MSTTLYNLIRGITPWGNNTKRIEHLENIAIAQATSAVPLGNVEDTTPIPAIGVTFPLDVDTTTWMAVGQRLAIANSGDLLYVKVDSITDGGTVVLEVIGMDGFAVSDPIPVDAEIIIATAPNDRIGFVSCDVGAGWVKNSGVYSPAITTGSVTVTFEGTGTRSLTFSRSGAVINVDAFTLTVSGITATVAGDGTGVVVFSFTDTTNGNIREYTVFVHEGADGADGADGAAGADGANVVNYGAWSGTDDYFATSTNTASVSHGGNLYVAKSDSGPSNGGAKTPAGVSDTWWELIGPVPSLAPDYTKTALEAGMAIDSGGIDIGTIGYMKSGLAGFDVGDLSGTPGFYLGKDGGGVGFLIGSTSSYLQYDGSTGDMAFVGGSISIGSGLNEFLVDSNKMQYGGVDGLVVDVGTGVNGDWVQLGLQDSANTGIYLASEPTTGSERVYDFIMGSPGDDGQFRAYVAQGGSLQNYLRNAADQIGMYLSGGEGSIILDCSTSGIPAYFDMYGGSTEYRAGGQKVIGARQTGWACTLHGTPARNLDLSTISTVGEVCQVLTALLQDLGIPGHGALDQA